MIKDFNKAVYFYLKNSNESKVLITKKEFYDNFMESYFELLKKIVVFEDLYASSSNFSVLNLLQEKTLYPIISIKKNPFKDQINIVRKRDLILSCFSCRDVPDIKFLLKFNSNGSMFFRVKKGNHIKIHGLINPLEDYISVNYSKKVYNQQITISSNKIELYDYNGNKKLKEITNFYNSHFIDCRKLTFDLNSQVPVESEVYFYGKQFYLKQSRGSKHICNINPDEENRSKKEKMVDSIVDFILESKGDFVSPVTDDDLTLFNMYFPSENLGSSKEIPF